MLRISQQTLITLILTCTTLFVYAQEKKDTVFVMIQQKAEPKMPHYKNPNVSGVLSFLVPGVGQFYNGQIGRGFIYMGLNALYWTGFNACLNNDDIVAAVAVLSAGVALNIVCIADAVESSRRINRNNGYQIGFSPSYEPIKLASNKKIHSIGGKIILTF